MYPHYIFKDKNYILQFIPKKYEYLKSAKKINYGNKHLKISYLYDIMHFFISKYYLYDKETINLSSTILRNKYGTFYNYYMNWLIDEKFIKIKCKYFTTVKCNTYQLLFKASENNVIRYKNEEKFLLKKWKNVANLENIESNNHISFFNYHQHLIDDLYKVNIDISSSVNYIENSYKNNIINEEAYIKNKLAIEMLNENRIYWKWDKYGRLHSNFTTIKKYIRNNFININNEPTVEYDIKNSQPLFLAYYFKKSDIPLNNELRDFCDKASNGEFYETLMNDEIDRKQAKKLVYKIFFGKNKLDKENKWFHQKWPHLHHWIKKYKSEAKNHAALAWKLQEKESVFIFKNVCEKIYNSIPNINLYTVHDSVVVPSKYSNVVADIFYNELNSIISYIQKN